MRKSALLLICLTLFVPGALIYSGHGYTQGKRTIVRPRPRPSPTPIPTDDDDFFADIIPVPKPTATPIPIDEPDSLKGLPRAKPVPKPTSTQSRSVYVADDIETLRGLRGVYVVVETIRADIEDAGLTTEQLQTDVELRLRKVGVRVLSESEWLATREKPYLYVNINVFKTDPGGDVYYPYSISVALIQQVYLRRRNSNEQLVLTPATTWNKGLLGLLGRDKLRSVREDVGELIDMFINAYLAANPK